MAGSNGHHKEPYISIYQRLLKLIPGLPDHIKAGRTTGKSHLSDGMMDLHFDYLGKDHNGNYLIALSHYYEQNGDLIPDPDMQIRVLPDLKAAEALTFQDAFRFREIYAEEDGKQLVDLNAKKSLNQFLKFWLGNLLQQGHRIDLKHDEESSATEKEPEPQESTTGSNPTPETEHETTDEVAFGKDDETPVDELTNQHGVYTPETAGKRFEEIEIPISKSAGHVAAISLVLDSDQKYRFGLRVSRKYGDHSSFGFLPNTNSDTYSSRHDVLKAAIRYVLEWLGPETTDKKISNTRKAVREFAVSQNLQLEEGEEKVTPAKDTAPPESYLWREEDNPYPVNKVFVRGQAYHQARLRSFLMTKLDALPIEDQFEIAHALKGMFKERRPLESYKSGTVTSGKSGTKRQSVLIGLYVDDIVVDHDLRNRTGHVLDYLMQRLIHGYDTTPEEETREPWEMSLQEFSQHVESYVRQHDAYPLEIWEVVEMLVRYFPETKPLLVDHPQVDHVMKIVKPAHLFHIIRAIGKKRNVSPEALAQHALTIPSKISRAGDAEYGFDATDFKSADTFLQFLEHTGMGRSWKECKYFNNLQSPAIYLWQGEDVRMVTANNPLLKEGYASFIGLSGSKEKVEKAAAYIEQHTDSKKDAGLDYINFNNLLCFDPSETFGDFPDNSTPPISDNPKPENQKNESPGDTGKKEMESLKKFAAFVSQYTTIHADTDDGKAKETFGRLGKKAFKELAVYLGLNPSDVAYNKAGIAVSGDLRLMGMVSPDKGIYIHFNKDGSTGVLYRVIEHMKDFSGGPNHYFEESDFAQPERIREFIARLVSMPPVPPKPTGTSEPVVTTSDQAVTLFRAIESGEQIERLPELIDLMNTPQVKQEIKTMKLYLHDLITSSAFRQNLRVNLWSLIPERFKKLKSISPVRWLPDPADKGLRTIVGDFTGQTEYRPNLMGANFDGQGIAATDAHRLIFLNSQKVKKKGIYCITKFYFKTMGKAGEDEAIIKEKFPEYAKAIPDQVRIIHTLHLDSLREFCQAMLKGQLLADKLPVCTFRYGDEQYVRMNAEFVEQAVIALLRLGYSKADIGCIAPDKALVLSPEGRMKDITNLSTPFVLLMPYHNEKNQPENGELYFSFSDHAVVTHGVDDAISLAPAESSPFVEKEDYTDRMIALLHEQYALGHRVTKKQLMAIAAEAGISNKGKIWEAAELSWLLWYKKLYRENLPFHDRLALMVRFWNNVQPTYDYSDSSKELFRQYSTPGPIAAIAAQYTGMDHAKSIFEPSAGNGLLVVGAHEAKTHVNETDPTRLASLQFQSFSKVTSFNAAKPFPDEMTEAYDVVVTNPPFAKWEDDQYDKDMVVRRYFDNHVGLNHHLRLEHVMTGLALRCMKDTGRAVAIIMGHIYFGDDGQVAKYRPFFNWLYRHYYVDDVVNLNSFKLYNKQGAVEKVMMILIRGRKEIPEGLAPTRREAPYLYDMVNSFEELWDRVNSSLSYSLDKIISQLKTALAA